MGCKTSKIAHDHPCQCQHQHQQQHLYQHERQRQEQEELIRTPSHSSSFYNSNSSNYSSDSAYSDDDGSRRPFFQPNHSNHSRPRIRKEGSGSSRSPKNKPLPRRNRSGREVKVIVPKPSNRRRKSPEPRRPEELAPWAVAEHNKLVPILQPVNKANMVNGNGNGNYNYNTNANSNANPNFSLNLGRGDSGINDRYPTNPNPNPNPNGNTNSRKEKKAKRTPASDYVVTGGYVVSPEVYYASLPLPDIPPTRHSEPVTRRDDVIVEQLRQNAEIVQARRMKEKEKGFGKFKPAAVPNMKEVKRMPNRI